MRRAGVGDLSARAAMAARAARAAGVAGVAALALSAVAGAWAQAKPAAGGPARAQAQAQAQGQAQSTAMVQAPASAPAAAPMAAGRSAASTAEQQLQAVRQALLDKAMSGRTQVSSTSWIDERGELREASEFRSDLQVRGVRVIEYTGTADAPQAVVHAEPAEPSGAAAEVCRDTATDMGWRHPVALQPGLLPGQSPLLTGPARQALGLLVESLQRQADLARGSLAVAAEAAPAAGNRYEQAVFGRAQPRQSLILALRVRMLEAEELRAAAPAWRRAWADLREWARWDEALERPAYLAMEISLGRAGESPRLMMERVVPLAVSGRQSPARNLMAGAAATLAAQASIAWMAVQDALACEPLSFEARMQGDGRFLLLAGRDAALEVGDRLVLSDSRHVPRRLLDAGAAPHLALIEITAVQAHRAEARWIAGPSGTMDPSATWVAMPYGLQRLPATSKAQAARVGRESGEAR